MEEFTLRILMMTKQWLSKSLMFPLSLTRMWNFLPRFVKILCSFTSYWFGFVIYFCDYLSDCWYLWLSALSCFKAEAWKLCTVTWLLHGRKCSHSRLWICYNGFFAWCVAWYAIEFCPFLVQLGEEKFNKYIYITKICLSNHLQGEREFKVHSQVLYLTGCREWKSLLMQQEVWSICMRRSSHPLFTGIFDPATCYCLKTSKQRLQISTCQTRLLIWLHACTLQEF